jgi:hypothetical protein
MPLQALTHLLDGRNVQRIIGGFADHYLRHHRQPQGIQRREHHFELRQIRAMILTVAELKQPILAHPPIATGRRAIQPHALRVQLVHADDALVEGRLKALPRFRLGQRIQHQRQPVITPRAFMHLLAGTQVQRVQPMGHPALDLIHPMIPFRQDVGQPDRCCPAQADSLPIAMWLEAFVQQLWYAHRVALGQQNWNIVYSFGRYRQQFCHFDSLPHFQNLVII